MSITTRRHQPAEAAGERLETFPDEPRARRWPLILLLCLAVIAVAVVAAVVVERRHETIRGARAQIVLVFPGKTADDSRERLVKTQAQVLESRSVLGPAARENGMSASELEEKLSIDTSLRSDVLTITTGDPDPAVARRLTAAIADRYLDLSQRLVPDSAEGEELVRRQIADVRRQLDAAASDDKDALRDRIGDLQDWVLELKVDALDRPRARLLTPTYVLDEPLRPQPLRAAAGGLGIGLLLAGVVVLVLLTLPARRKA